MTGDRAIDTALWAVGLYTVSLIAAYTVLFGVVEGIVMPLLRRRRNRRAS